MKYANTWEYFTNRLNIEKSYRKKHIKYLDKVVGNPQKHRRRRARTRTSNDIEMTQGEIVTQEMMMFEHRKSPKIKRLVDVSTKAQFDQISKKFGTLTGPLPKIGNYNRTRNPPVSRRSYSPGISPAKRIYNMTRLGSVHDESRNLNYSQMDKDFARVSVRMPTMSQFEESTDYRLSTI